MHDCNNILIIQQQRFEVTQNQADCHLDNFRAYCSMSSLPPLSVPPLQPIKKTDIFDNVGLLSFCSKTVHVMHKVVGLKRVTN